MSERPISHLGGPIPFDWRPITIHQGRRTAVRAGVRDFKAHLSAALRMTAGGSHRILVHRHSQLLAALVPLPDFWFIADLEAALDRKGWKDAYPFLEAGQVATALDRLRPAPYLEHKEARTPPPRHPATLVELAVWWETVEPLLRREEARARREARWHYHRDYAEVLAKHPEVDPWFARTEDDENAEWDEEIE